MWPSMGKNHSKKCPNHQVSHRKKKRRNNRVCLPEFLLIFQVLYSLFSLYLFLKWHSNVSYLTILPTFKNDFGYQIFQDHIFCLWFHAPVVSYWHFCLSQVSNSCISDCEPSAHFLEKNLLSWVISQIITTSITTYSKKDGVINFWYSLVNWYLTVCG